MNRRDDGEAAEEVDLAERAAADRSVPAQVHEGDVQPGQRREDAPALLQLRRLPERARGGASAAGDDGDGVPRPSLRGAHSRQRREHAGVLRRGRERASDAQHRPLSLSLPRR